MTTADDLRCSIVAREASLQPTGTAGSYDAFLLVEVPLPWPREITDHAVFDGVQVPEGTRVQGMVPSPDNVAEGRMERLRYTKPAGRFTRYEGAPDGVTDLLVCTHGARDRCCGSLGTSLLLRVGSRPGLRVRRTSHTGGHRFAPTALVLPQGTMWGWLDDDVVTAVLDRTREPAELMAHYRGSTAMPDPWTQVAEAAVFAEVGWPWLDEAREARRLDDGIVLVESTAGEWEVEIDDRGIAPQPVCGEPPSPGGKGDRQLFAGAVRRLR